MEKLIITSYSDEEFRKIICECVRIAVTEYPLKTAHSLPESSSELLSVKEAAVFLKISVQTMYDLMHKKQIVFQKRRKLCYFWKSDLIAYVNEGRRKSNTEIEVEAQEYFKNHKNKNHKK